MEIGAPGQRCTVIVGAGSIGWAVAHKAAQFPDDFGVLILASRTEAKCRKVAASVRAAAEARGEAWSEVACRQLDANDPEAVASLLQELKPLIVVNVGPPSVNVTVMQACCASGSPCYYLDTSVAVDLFSPGQQVPHCYDPQWRLRGAFEEAGIVGVLGCGFDPGAVSAFARHAARHFRHVESIDVMDVNAGTHGRAFATNFDPETNLLEIQGDSWWWDDGAWRSAPAHSRFMDIEFPEDIGRHRVYSMAHDEVRSLAEFFPSARRIEFWMGFSDEYLRFFRCLRDVGMLSPALVTLPTGVQVSPLAVLKAVLPDPTALAPAYTGRTCIGTWLRGTGLDGRRRSVFVYNIACHQDAFADVRTQAIAYTTAVPAVTAALLLLRGAWPGGGGRQGLYNVEELDPQPFLDLMPRVGLGYRELDWSE